MSGIEQALIDLQAKSLGLSPMELIGGQKRTEIAIYANINRGTVDRSPEELGGNEHLRRKGTDTSGKNSNPLMAWMLPRYKKSKAVKSGSWVCLCSRRERRR